MVRVTQRRAGDKLAGGHATQTAKQDSTFRVMMFIHVTEAKYLQDYKVWLAFNDGSAGAVDLSSELSGELFEPLRDTQFFQSFTLEGHTLSWPNGADFAPEFLREYLQHSDASDLPLIL